MLQINRAFEAYLDAMDQITILLPKPYGTSGQFLLKRGSEEWNLPILRVSELPQFTKYECRADAYLELGQSYAVADERGAATDLQAGAVIRTKEFDEAYHYGGDDLGVSFTAERSTFKVWAPTASQAKVRLFGKTAEDHSMVRGQNGVWSCEVPGNLDGLQYTYLVCINLVWREAVDPYARAVSANGERGVVIDLQKAQVQDDAVLPPLPHFTDAIIYEAHIRDLTIHPDSGVWHKGLYLGLTEEHTKSGSGNATGLAYLRDLGVTHVELLPVHDFEGVDEFAPWQQYNWGYNPVHFNAPEGSYATEPNDPYARIRELKQLIAAFHRNGLRVIMDAVYNHVYIRETSSFEKLVPGYYFRHDANGMPSNGTGVGNDLAPERKMVQKFIVDSVMYWLREYRLDGFRFDLMGILDHETMNLIRRRMDAERSGILLLGEGWDLPTPLPAERKATLYNAHKMPRIAQFNDRFRDAIKGSTFHVWEKGYAGGRDFDKHGIEFLLRGSIASDAGAAGMFGEPDQTINYVESHDNWTLWDKLAISNHEEAEEIRRRRHLLATAVTLLAQGIPFLHAGQEFFRTKHGVENSYNAPDEINWMDWRRKEEYSWAVEYVRGLIEIRKAHGALRLPSASLIRRHAAFLPAPGPTILYHLRDVGKWGAWSELLLMFHNEMEAREVTLPEGKWHVLAEGQKAQPVPLRTFTGSRLLLQPISTYVLAKM
ncbi:type I pullulanase [Ectobacillus ponti]|uniref:Type I pullulanase n=1 Tax=Ectobacillus ponti TaxID=2961894 RepID=A0AA42BRL5_9BACI|nr:type I pullulanase [Ectobacillus ponti]MCP8967498.1 type I pullulanase [Ectobacillus ponti]